MHAAARTFTATIHDAREGRIVVAVVADDADAAHEEAMIAAAEHGCADVTDIELELEED